jgi:nitrogen regulatory protein PII
MKKIEAVILPSRVDAVRGELRRRGVCDELTLTEVKHCDTYLPLTSSSGCFDEQLQKRVKVELIVGDQQVDKAVSLILRYALPEFHEPNGHVTLLNISEIVQATESVPEI